MTEGGQAGSSKFATCYQAETSDSNNVTGQWPYRSTGPLKSKWMMETRAGLELEYFNQTPNNTSYIYTQMRVEKAGGKR